MRSKKITSTLCVLTLVVVFIHLGHEAFSSPLSQKMVDQLFEETTEDACQTYLRYLEEEKVSISSYGGANWGRKVGSSVQMMRIYGKCVFDAKVTGVNFTSIESRLFPAFTRKLPKVWCANSEKLGDYHKSPLMRIDPLDGFKGTKQTDRKDEKSDFSRENLFWEQIRTSLSGKGIAISVGMVGAGEVVRLLRVLRQLQNTLPIEVIHRGELSRSSIRRIFRAATDENSGSGEYLGPPQTLCFINTDRAVKSEYQHLFTRFSNKWLAVLFTTFREVIVMDLDVVPFVPPETFFNLEYKRTGAFFFRDRSLEERISPFDINMYESLLPTEKEKVFNISAFPNDLLFAGRKKHVMEAGVVVLNRSTHFSGLLISMSMQLWPKTSSPVYGDKELFWLGQLAAGQQSFAFNRFPAGTIGKYEHLKGGTICSTQPAHFDENLTLLWTNGGLVNCKKSTWVKDYKKQPQLRLVFGSAQDLKSYYKSKIEVDAGIIPEKSFYHSPERGCNGYVWCADGEGGIVKWFGKEELENIQSIVNVW